MAKSAHRDDVNAESSIRVVLAEDSFLMSEAMEMVFNEAPEFELVARCSRLEELMAAVDEHAPQVVVSDIRMPPDGIDEGIRMAERLRESHPGTGVVIVSQYLDPGYVLRLFDGGASGRAYLLKERIGDRNQLLRAAEAVAEGGSVIDPLVVDTLVRARERAESSPLAQLTPRERDVLAGVAQGKSNATIAAELYLTKRAVEKYVHAIFIKLGMPDDISYSRRVKAALLFLGHEPASTE